MNAAQASSQCRASYTLPNAAPCVDHTACFGVARHHQPLCARRQSVTRMCCQEETSCSRPEPPGLATREEISSALEAVIYLTEQAPYFVGLRRLNPPAQPYMVVAH